MSQQEQTSRIAVLLFTDIVDSVALERRLGTKGYSRLLQRHHQLFRQSLERAGGGKVYQDTGDGFLAEFPTAAHAVNTALLFQTFLRENMWDSEVPKVRVGINQGQLAELRLDPSSPAKLVGMPVSIASRVLSLAQGGQILMTRPVYEDARQFVRHHPASQLRARSAPNLKWKTHGFYLFKGADEPIEVFEVGASGVAPLTPPPDSEKAQRIPSPERIAPIPRSWPIGAGLTALCGILLLATPLGDSFVNASYDYLFRFGSRAITNKIQLVLMDNEAYEELNQRREQPWSRARHAQLLNKLADDGCRLVVIDVFFGTTNSDTADEELFAAMRRQKHMVLTAKQAEGTHPNLESARPLLPAEAFLAAVGAKWGVAWFDRNIDADEIVRRHWPFPAPDAYPSLGWTASELLGAHLNKSPQKQWLRYYGSWKSRSLSYHFALTQTTNYFRDSIVFIGNKPRTSAYDREIDEFSTPYTRWTGESTGGVEILATSFLNLLNGDWLRRPAWPLEALAILLSGSLLGWGLCHLRPLMAICIALSVAIAVTLGGVLLSYFTNFWFPWLIMAGAQVPIALAWAIVPLPAKFSKKPAVLPWLRDKEQTIAIRAADHNVPDAPEYEIFEPPFGEGGFGKVWLVRNAIGQWQALKAVYQANFNNSGPYEAEFNGLQKYKPISEKHPGLLRIDLVSRKKEDGYFYYVMELGDARAIGWEKNPPSYKPKDLESVRKQADKSRLPLVECLQIGICLADALEFLHAQGLTHRDIKPSNVIFVNGRPKLADVGLVADIRPTEMLKTWVGTAGYMPPPPEHPGTVQADLYAFGMLLYVVSTGREPAFFPEVSATLMEKTGNADFMLLNPIILKACQPDRALRFKTAAELLCALNEAQARL